MKTPTKEMERVTIPDWAIDRERQDLGSLIAAVVLAGFEGRWIRLSAVQQRAIMGKAYFGRRHFRATASEVTVSRKVCYGMDFDSVTLDSQGWSDMVRRGCLG